MWAVFKRLFFYVKGHRVTALVILCLGAPASPFLYQLGSDFVGGRWSGGGVDLYLHSERLWRNEPVYFFYTSPDISNDERVVVPVELSVHNDSDKAANKVTLSIKYPKSSDRHRLPETAQRHSGSVSDKELTHDVNSSEKFAYSNYRLSFMPPRDSVSLVDGAFAVPVDKAGGSFVSLPLGLDVKASLSSETSASQEWELRYRAVLAQNSGQLRKWVEYDYGQRLARELREREGFWKYTWGWLSRKKVTVFGFYPQFNYVPGLKFYIPSQDPDEYKRFRFSPYSYELFFGGD